ncbi:hypothetical protein FXO38_27239 [Capsicum annuum]|nr:hypothetical protein FXO38_27239 [Capsicum annuum]KAF3633158.1 hypothetical protein FXO37_27175 [Capsicum annuum]
MNLRELQKKFGRNIGLNLNVVRRYAKQLFCALKHVQVVVNETRNKLKLCDFGNAMFAGKNEITPYLVSHFYRAPEISRYNNDMLRLHMELKGPFPKKMLRKGAFTYQHFDQDLNFLGTDEDPVTKKAIRKLIVNVKAKEFSSIISGYRGE